jgi:ribonuclease J
MDHSAFQAAAFEIRCEGKRLVYTGDFRGHGRRREYLERFLAEAEKEPDLLLIEGTTLGRTGEAEGTEEALTEAFKKVMEDSRGIVLCQPASQNIDRIITIYKAAKACGKTMVVDRYTANLLKELRKIGYKELPAPSLFRPDIRVYNPLERLGILGVTGKMIRLRQKQIVMLVRPSMLPALKLMNLEGGVQIYSQWQVYRRKPAQIRLDYYLASRGFTGCYLHTSGHAFEEDIKKVITGLSPKEIVPIHTFCPEAFLSFSDQAALRQDGTPFQL